MKTIFGLFLLGALSNFMLVWTVLPAVILAARLPLPISHPITAYFLGYIFGLAPASLASHSPFALPLLIYLSSLSLYHLFEYLFVYVYHHKEIKWDSFLLNHSKAYVAAQAVSFIEYALMRKYNSYVFGVGLVMVVIGHFCRIGAMFTAQKSFHHIVQHEKAPTHVLVTSGIYAYLRHPSYFGWQMWAVGTQVMLCNPISATLNSYASYKFFVDRIPYEESKLYEFFGNDYKEYCAKVPIRMLFIESYFD